MAADVVLDANGSPNQRSMETLNVDDSAVWKSLHSPPDTADFSHCNILPLNSRELLVVPNAHAPHSLFRYNFNTDTWSEWHKFSDSLSKDIMQYQTSQLNDDTSMLYMFGDPGYIVTMDLQTAVITTSKQHFHDGAHSCSVWFEQQLHIFGGWTMDGKAHFVWNEPQQTLVKITDFSSMECGRLTAQPSLNRHSVMLRPSNKSVLIMPMNTNNIYEYSLVTHKYERLLPQFGGFRENLLKALMSKDERFVICILNSHTELRRILILELETLSIRESKIKCPDYTGTYVTNIFLRDDHYKREMVTNGYLREQYAVALPVDIVGVIQYFNSFEYLHILNSHHHWSVSLDQVFDDKSYCVEIPVDHDEDDWDDTIITDDYLQT